MWVRSTKANTFFFLLARGSPEKRFVPDIEFLAHPDRGDWNPGEDPKKQRCEAAAIVSNRFKTNYPVIFAPSCPFTCYQYWIVATP